MHAAAATLTRLPPLNAIIMATINPAKADQKLSVASRMAGNVITDKVT